MAAGQAVHLERAGITKQRVLEEYRRIAFLDPRGFWDVAGHLKTIGQLSEEQGSVLAGFEAVIKNAAAGDGVTDLVQEPDGSDRARGLVRAAGRRPGPQRGAQEAVRAARNPNRSTEQ
jgi:hypothetical protein